MRSAAAGGDLGWANPGQFVPEFENAMNAIADWQNFRPDCFTIWCAFAIGGRTKTKSVERPSEQRDIAETCCEKKFDDAYANWIRDLRSNAYVEYRDIQQ